MRSLIYFFFFLFAGRVFSATCVGSGATDEVPQLVCQNNVNLVTLPGVCFATYTPVTMNYFRQPEIATGVPFPGSAPFGAQDTRFSSLSSTASTACTTGNTGAGDANFISGIVNANGFAPVSYNPAQSADQLYTCISTTLSGANFDPVTNNARYYWGGQADDRTITLAVNGVVNSVPGTSSFNQFNFAGPTASGNVLIGYTWQNNCPLCSNPNPTGSGFVLHGQNFRLNTIGYTDNCLSVPTLNYSPPTQVSRTGPIGTTITASATDSAGQTGTCSYTVVVLDNQPPVITFCPLFYQVFNTPGTCTANVDPAAAVTATDNCGFTLTSAPIPSGGLYPIGDTAVTVTATDPEGNTDVCPLEVTVIYRYQCPGSVLSTLTVNSANPSVQVSGSTAIAASNLCDTACGQFSGNAQAIYSFVGPSGGIYGVDVQLLSSNFAGAGFAVIRCGVDLKQICDVNYTTSGVETVPTIPGATYYVVVYSQTPGASGSFTLQLSVNACAEPSFS